MELLPQTENIFLVYKDGWHSPEASPREPGLERTWTKKEALVSFKNPKKDVIVYLEADTSVKSFSAAAGPHGLGGRPRSGLVIPIENSEVFLKKIRVKAEDLGTDEWVDLRADDEPVVRAEAPDPAPQQRRPRAGAARVPPATWARPTSSVP